MLKNNKRFLFNIQGFIKKQSWKAIERRGAEIWYRVTSLSLSAEFRTWKFRTTHD